MSSGESIYIMEPILTDVVDPKVFEMVMFMGILFVFALVIMVVDD